MIDGFVAAIVVSFFGGIIGANNADNAFIGFLVGAAVGLVVGPLAAWPINRMLGQAAEAKAEATQRQNRERQSRETQERARAVAAKHREAEARQREAEGRRLQEAEERQRQVAEARALAEAQVLQWKDVPHSAPLHVPGGPAPLRCDECAGTGVVTRKVVTTEITLVTPTETRPCGACSGTGTGRKAQIDELKEYLAEPSPLLAQVFALAKEKAELLGGLQGRITTPDGVIPLLAKDSWYRVEGSRVDRGAATQEDTDTVTQYCLTTNGSFLVRDARHETWLDSSRWTQVDEGWGSWTDSSRYSIDDFMSEFDFTARGGRNQTDLHERSEQVRGSDYYTKLGHLDLRRIYGVKGEGLLAALMNTHPS